MCDSSYLYLKKKNKPTKKFWENPVFLEYFPFVAWFKRAFQVIRHIFCHHEIVLFFNHLLLDYFLKEVTDMLWVCMSVYTQKHCFKKSNARLNLMKLFKHAFLDES